MPNLAHSLIILLPTPVRLRGTESMLASFIFLLPMRSL